MIELNKEEKEYLRSNKNLLQNTRNLMKFYDKCYLDAQKGKLEIDNIGRFTEYFLSKEIDVFKYLREYIPKFCFFFTDLKEVRIPNYIKHIRYGAFFGGMVEKLYIPKSVESISNKAFQNCSDLKEIEFEGTIDPFEIGISAFRNINKNAHIIVHNKELYKFFEEMKEHNRYNWNIELR